MATRGQAQCALSSLLARGVAVIPCFAQESLPQIKAEFLHALRTLPELREETEVASRVPAFGGFGALGLPSSFHHPFIRLLRREVYKATRPLFEMLLPVLDEQEGGEAGAYNLEQLVDRVQLRPAGATPTAESFHRDLSVYGPGCSAVDGDHIFGGWVNLDETPQGFSCVLGTHVPGKNSAVGASGFNSITSRAEIEQWKAQRSLITIPPGHLILFYSNIVHEVLAKKRSFPSARMYCGWRCTTSMRPLFDDFEARMAQQEAIALPSRQEPPLHAKLHWTNWPAQLQAWSIAMLKPQYLVERTVKSGKRANERFTVAPQVLRSSGIHYPAYTDEELALHRPHRVAPLALALPLAAYHEIASKRARIA